MCNFSGFLSTFPDVLHILLYPSYDGYRYKSLTLFLFVLDSLDIITINTSPMSYASNMAGVY